jgi:SAM-dependent methyltransferase
MVARGDVAPRTMDRVPEGPSPAKAGSSPAKEGPSPAKEGSSPPKRPTLRNWVRRVALPVFRPARTELVPPPWRYMMMRPIPFEIWFRLRALRFSIFGAGTAAIEGAERAEGRAFNAHAFSHNRSKLWTFYRVRTERLMSIVRCVSELPADAKVLCIGPRNEAELLLLHLYGFRLENVTGVDLFSYSPKIRCMDMHQLEFPDDTFDVVYVAWALTYSGDVSRACSEIARVVKPGGIVAAAIAHSAVDHVVDPTNAPVGTTVDGGIPELLGYFEPHVDWVFWQEQAPRGKGAWEATAVFRVGKPARSAK